MKKRYSNYFKECMAVAIVALIGSIILGMIGFTALSVAAGVFSFTSWFAGVMAPDHEKYMHMCVKETIMDDLSAVDVTSCCKHPIKESSNYCPACGNQIYKHEDN